MRGKGRGEPHRRQYDGEEDGRADAAEDRLWHAWVWQEVSAPGRAGAVFVTLAHGPFCCNPGLARGPAPPHLYPARARAAGTPIHNGQAMDDQAASGDPRKADRVYGIIGAALAVLALFFLLRGGDADTGAAAPASVPQLAVQEPRDGAEAALPLAVVFDAGVPLTAGPSGWNAAGRHVHLLVGGTELMAGGNDIQPLGGTRYRWTVAALPRGEQTLRLSWSDEQHRAVAEGASRPVRVRIR